MARHAPGPAPASVIVRSAVWHWRTRLRIIPKLPPDGQQGAHAALVRDLTDYMDCEDRRLSGLAQRVQRALVSGRLLDADMVMTEWLGED